MCWVVVPAAVDESEHVASSRQVGRAVAQVVVSGAVSKPTKLTFERPTTVFQAVMEAGGVSEYGNLKRVHLIRVVNDKQLTQVLDLRPDISGKTTNALYVKDGDVIYVPQSAF